MLGAEEWLVIRVIALATAVAGMAYALNLPWVQHWERRLGITQLAVAGLPLIALGMLARSPSVGVLSDSMLVQLSPLIGIALAAIGMRIGLRVDVSALVATSRDVSLVAVIRLAVLWGVLFVVSFVTLQWLGAPGGLRAAAILATIGSVMSAEAVRQLRGLLVMEDRAIIEQAARIVELACIALFLVLNTYTRTSRSELAPEIWLLNAIGVAVVLGTCAAVLFRDPAAQGVDGPVFAIGTVSVIAGIAMFLDFSPLTIATLAGITLGQVARDRQAELEAAFDRYQRAIFGMLLFLLGAVAIPVDLASVVLAIVFVIARIGAAVLATRLMVRAARLDIARATNRHMNAAPLGATSVALVLAAYLLGIDIIQTGALAVVFSTLAAELLVHARSGED